MELKIESTIFPSSVSSLSSGCLHQHTTLKLDAVKTTGWSAHEIGESE